jgi:hypothetical protein
MRCIGCGHEMRLVKAVADCTMMVPGYEHQTLECTGCRTVERRMVFGRTIGPLAVEPMRLPSDAPASAADPEPNDRVEPPKTYSVKTWARALERLRNTQSTLKERAAAAMASETINEFYRTWDGFTGSARNARQDNGSEGISERPQSATAKPSGSARKPDRSVRPKNAHVSAPVQMRAEPAGAPMSAMARAVAKLRSRQAKLAASGVAPVAPAAPPQVQTFDQMWEGLPAVPRRPGPAIKPSALRPRPLAKSRSLVPLDVHPEVTSSLWARAVAMLQSRQG